MMFETWHGSRATGIAADKQHGQRDNVEEKHEARPLTQVLFETLDHNQKTPKDSNSELYRDEL